MQKNLSFYPVCDTFVDSLYKDKNYSKAQHHYLGFFKKSIKYRILMKFNLSSIPKDCSVIEAKLRLYCTRNDYMEKSSIFSVHPIISNWNIDTVNFANQPPFDPNKKVLTEVGCELWEYISFDISEYIKYWLSHPQNNFGVIIKAENEENDESLIAVSSQRVDYIDWKPRLEVKISISDTSIKSDSLNKVAIVTPQFFQLDGNRCLFGGGERYLIDLCKLIKKCGYHVDVFQPTNGERWERTYDGVKIYGISARGFDRDFFIELNKKFHEVTKDYDHHLYLNMDMTYPYVFPGSICISHGVWWDSTERVWWRSDIWYERIFHGLNAVDVLVSVDTNTINWINAVKPDLKCKKVYIPNYVDLDVFKPDVPQNDKGYIKILYPRRLYPARGWSICKELAVELTHEYENLIFSFVGRGDSEAVENHMRIFSKKHPRIEYTWLEMNEMYKAYKDTDIVLIPSLNSEGTSLSLLEAMACGKPVIAGLVGGLTDLILQGFNGYLIEVNKENLKNAIVELINDKDLRLSMGENAKAVAQKFSKKIWEQRWEKVIKEQFK